MRRKANRLDHADGAGDALAGDIERRTVIDRRAQDRHAAGDRYRAFKVQRFRRDMPLIVIERQDNT